jgi:GNAT superfamily N-acetyltransferase
MERTLIFMDGKLSTTSKTDYNIVYKSNKITDIVNLLKDFAEEANWEYCNLYYIKDYFKTQINNPNGIWFTLEYKNKIVGVICGLLHQHIYDPEKIVLTELVWYVDKNYRNNKYNLKLIKYFENKGKELGADKIFLTLRMSLKSESVEKFYKRLGYKEEEKTFSRVL